ncbi:energy-coupling factor ABC transporter permease [Deferribacterales bacterium RsTz2092]|nr:cobalamin biosynthesis protein CbiM [Deferribacterales bacterium]
MHMADALLSAEVGGIVAVVGAGAIGYSASKLKRAKNIDRLIPLMGVMGAFVFAGQMLNFTIPGTGSSGHIGGGLLLSALLGPYAALITIASILVVQCLFFADGGLLALGCNIFNMGVIPAFIAYPLIYKPLVSRSVNVRRLSIASFIAVVVGLQLGAFGVVLETSASRIAELPLVAFVLLMQPIHLAIGVGEGLATAAVLSFIYGSRPELIFASLDNKEVNIPVRGVVVALAVAAVLMAGGLSLVASQYPDGLEWAIERSTGGSDIEVAGPVHSLVANVQAKSAFMPDYDSKFAGIVGGLITLVLATSAGLVIARLARWHKKV